MGWGIVVSRQAAEFFLALVVPRELLGTPVRGAQPRCHVQLGGIPATPYSFRCRVSESHTSSLRPKGCHTDPNTSGCHRAALRQEGNVFSCTRGKISAGSDCCQLGTAPQSTQVPLQPSFGELTRCLGTHPEAAADVVVGPGTLGQSSSIPAAPSPRLSLKKHLAWTFPEGVFPGQLSPFSGLINARGSGPGDKALKPSQNMERTYPEIVPVMGQWGIVRWDGEKMSPKGLTAGQHRPKAELWGCGELLGQANPAQVCDTGGAEPRTTGCGLLQDQRWPQDKVTGGRRLKAAAHGHAGTDRGTDRELSCGRGR